MAYAVFAFLLGVTAGMLLRRVVPAIAVTLVIYAVVMAIMPLWVRAHLVPVEHETVALDVHDLRGMSVNVDNTRVFEVFGQQAERGMERQQPHDHQRRVDVQRSRSGRHDLRTERHRTQVRGVARIARPATGPPVAPQQPFLAAAVDRNRAFPRPRRRAHRVLLLVGRCWWPIGGGVRRARTPSGTIR
ncbi:hypothetical protein [Cryptosporangium sp. NPDC051539]|uniref:hypothetical protein n=1 Tax=Cryptosporangium sp. NPDC051539 TaxID=3363962 RepID=UPI00378F00E1